MRLIVVGDCVSLKRSSQPSANIRKDRSIDRKGIKRGACIEQECSDCDTYFHDPSRGSQCQYCGCFPTKHRRIDDSIASSVSVVSEIADLAESQPPPEIHIIDNGSDTMIYEIDDSGNVLPDDSPLEILDVPPTAGSSHMQTEQTVLENKASPFNPNYLASFRESVALVSSFPKKSSLPKNKECTSKDSQKNLNPKLNFDKLVSQMSQEQLYEFCVPSHIPMRPNFPRKAESLSKSDALFMIRWIAWSMWNLQITAESDFIAVANLALKRYPALNSALSKDNGVDGFVKFLKHLLGYQLDDTEPTEFEVLVQPQQHQQNQQQQQHQQMQQNHKHQQKQLQQQQQQKQQLSNKENSLPSLKQYETLKSHICKEMNKLNPSRAVLRTFLSSCRKQRRSGLSDRKQDYSTQLLEFPCLQLQDLVMWEFIQQEQLQCTEQDLKKRWLDAVPTMASYFLSQSHKVYTSLTEDQATLEILQHLTSTTLFGPEASEKRGRSSCVVEVFKGNILPMYVFPQKGDPPRLFAIQDEEIITVYVYVDGTAVFKGPIVDALIHIVAVYFVFDFTPSPHAAPALTFIYGILMNEKALGRYTAYPPVVQALEVIWNAQ